MYAPAGERLREAWHRRADTDYRFEFWTALGWTILTFGIFSYYVAYQLCRRMKEHNIRRLQLLEATNELAWQRAVATGRSEELTPAFQRVAAHLDVLRRMTTDFRDPGLWLVIVLLSSGIGLIVLYVLLDQDLVKHAHAEAGAEAELAAIARALGAPLPPTLPSPVLRGQHNYAGRVVAVLGTCGIYAYWWLFNLMDDGNRHFERDWSWEDAVVPVLAAA
jgi:hypothetical protein